MKFPWYARSMVLKFIAILFCLFIIFPVSTSAHGTLTQVDPQPGSQLAQSPVSIKLAFNEAISPELYYIQVWNSQGTQVTTESAKLASNSSELELALPSLPIGTYTVQYHVISADGHPVTDSYPFEVVAPSVTPPAQPTVDVELPEPISMPGYDAHQHGDQDLFSIAMVVQYVARGLWYISLLALLGWLVWLRLLPSGLAHYVPTHVKMLHILQRVHFISLLLVVLSNVEDLLGTNDITTLKQLFLATSVGMSLSGLLLLGALGFLFLGRNIALDFLWIILMLGFKGISGHAVAISSPWVTMPLNTIHIFVASLWVAGLLLLLICWKKQESTIYLILERFSYVAMFSLIGLGITGTLMIFTYLPQLSYLLYSMWGIFLIAKVAIVLLIASLSWMLKRYIRRRELRVALRLLKLEISAMVVVLLLVGFISYLAPLPNNEKLNWHVMGETIHMTTEIQPMQLGSNTFRVKVWLPEKSGEPSSVKMTLRYLENSEGDVIDVPVKEHVMDSEQMGFAMVQHTFQAYGPYLPYRGKYQLEVKVIEREGKETVYQKEIRLY
jgi:copper transport protein